MYICLSEAKASLRLRILTTSGSKKGTQIYYLFLSNVSANEHPQGFPKGPNREGGPLTGHFAYLSKTSSFGFPSKGALLKAPSPRNLLTEIEMPHPQSLFIQLSKPPADEPCSGFPNRSPYEKRCPSPEPFLNILQGPRQGSPPSRFPSYSSHTVSGNSDVEWHVTYSKTRLSAPTTLR